MAMGGGICLRVTVESATGLRNSDHESISDPYVKLWVQKKDQKEPGSRIGECQTVYVGDSLDPIWEGQVFDFDVDSDMLVSSATAALVCEVYNDNTGSGWADALMGRAELPLSELTGSKGDKVLTLDSTEGENRVDGGDLGLSYQLMDTFVSISTIDVSSPYETTPTKLPASKFQKKEVQGRLMELQHQYIELPRKVTQPH